MSPRGLLSIVTMLFAMVGSPAAAGDSVVAQLQGPSPIRDYAGIQVFSVLEGRDYHLAIRRGGSVEILPVAPSKSPFDADVGPDAQGKPMLVYSRCKVERYEVDVPTGEARCDIVSYSLSGSGAERPVRGADTPASETSPTVWMGRIAFARTVKGRRFDAVYTRMLDAPRGTPSARVPGVPHHLAGHEPTRSGSVEELDLHGRTLAELLSYDAPYTPGGGAGYEEVRLVSIASRASRSALRTGIGIGAQMLAGVGFADGYVGFAVSCVYGCEPLREGMYRYRLRGGTLEWARFSPLVEREVVGMALASATSAYTIDDEITDEGCGVRPDDPDADRPCPIVFAGNLRFKPVG